MKIKTLLALALVLVMAIFVVACGEEETTTAGSDPEGPAATTTKATTTKATTTKKTTVTTTKVTTAKREITFDIPAKLPDGKSYDATLIFDGTEANNTIGTKKQDGTGATYDIFTLADGNKVFAYHIMKDWMEGSVVFDPYIFSGEEDGFLIYCDVSQTKPNEKACLGPRLKIDSTWYQIGSHANSLEKVPESAHNYGYYLLDGTAEWVKAENYSNCRLAVPAQFKGWIYMPFDQVSMDGANAQTLTDYIVAYPGVCEFTEVMIYNGNIAPAEGAESSDCYFDNFLVVTTK